jgi:hypothetical protein
LSIKIGLALLIASGAGAFGGQIPLIPANVIGFFGDYTICPTCSFPASSILNQQTGSITETTQTGYWLNSDNGPANAYIVIDLGAAYNVTSFDLFNTHNAKFGDRGTGNFSIEASNSLGAGPSGSSGFDLGGTIVSLGTHTLSAANPVPLNGLLVDQTFSSSDPGFYRFLRFSPHSVASVNPPCCGPNHSTPVRAANSYGLDELRVFGNLAVPIPEPASVALLAGGFLALSLLRKRTS